jgi:hypothetical protein
VLNNLEEKIKKTHQDYIDSIEVGTLIAFKMFKNEAKMYSAKVTKIGDTKLEVQTKNGKSYFILKSNVIWVNNNGRWPRFVMNAFRGLDEPKAEVESEQVEEKVEEEKGVIEENVAEEVKEESGGKTEETDW